MDPSELQKIVTQANRPVVVDFWAPWCMPCRVTKPVLEKLARQYADQVTFLPINADTSRELVQRSGILGIPTVLVFQHGRETYRLAGAQSESTFAALFNALAEGTEVKVGLTSFERGLRLLAGLLFALAGLVTGSWLLVGVGGLLAFLGVYDRCPVWRAVVTVLRKTFSPAARG